MPWRKSFDKRQQKSESTQQGMRTPINQSFMHPQLMMTTIVKNKGTDKAACRLCCRQQKGFVFRLPRTQLVFLQVPGFKELQAFLHRQAFFQTLGRDEGRREKKQWLAPMPDAGCQHGWRLQAGGGAGRFLDRVERAC